VPGFVAILSAELHFPEAGSLKGKRKHVLSAKAQLQNRFGASVAEVDQVRAVAQPFVDQRHQVLVGEAHSVLLRTGRIRVAPPAPHSYNIPRIFGGCHGRSRA